MRLHHVQVAIPRGGEDRARVFYLDGLGLREVPKPEAMRARGGAWFVATDGDTVTAEIHLGVEDPFAPAAKATVNWAQRHTVEGTERFHCLDPFGNRVELLCPA